MSDETLLKQVADILSQQTEILTELKESNVTKAPSATVHTAVRLHGSGGIWAGPGLEREVITAHIRPEGLASLLPTIPSTSEDPRFASLTGFTGAVGDQPDNACDEAPKGYVKGCNLTARFGRIRFDTNTIEMDKVMLTVNRGDFTDLVLRGRLLGLTNLVPSGMSESDVLDVITMSEMVTAGILMERELTNQLWQGVVAIANNFPGLDVQIATGQKDADTGALCTALDSDVKDYNFADLGNDIIEYVSMLEWYVRHNARKMGLMPVSWVWVMRADLWYELTAIWPCAYNTDRCTGAVGANSTVFIDGRENVTERDLMREGMFLTVNGTRYPVVIDDGIFEHNNINNGNLEAGEYASTIYLVPLTIAGGMPVTYREYVDYRRAQPDISLLRGLEEFWWTDGGVYSWAVEQVRWCYELSLKTEQRVILRAPQVAGRIDSVKYSPLQHLRDSDPDSAYHFNGGVSVRGGISSPNAVWNP